jgi:hypothetical protein
MLERLLPVESLGKAKDTWGVDDQYLEAVSQFVKKISQTKRLDSHKHSSAWIPKLEELSDANELKVTTGRMVARRWLQSNIFWSYEDIDSTILWFTAMPALELKDEDVEDTGFDHTRTLGWLTPPNWEKIRD